MRHPILDFKWDPHTPNNDPSQVHMALENIFHEVEDDHHFGNTRADQERIGRLEAMVLLLAAKLVQQRTI